MQNLNSNSPPHNLKIEIFRERCEAKALLWCSGYHALQDSVDELARFADELGLDVDLAQEIMAAAFEARRIRT